MSQSVVTTSSIAGPVRIRAGWDRPLGQLFCNVQLVDAARSAEDDDDLPACFFCTSYETVQAMLDSLGAAGIELPAGMIEAVRQDVLAGAGNVLRDFDSSPPRRLS